MKLQLRRINLHQDTTFAFTCRRCLTCCHNKKIQVNPYEIARLAKNRGLSTAQFLICYTTEEETYLKWDENGACVFLDSRGCSVHQDRPLVCRLYPLGRHVLPTLEESYSEIEPDPECGGVYGETGKIMDYLESQNAHPFMAAADKYLSLFWQLYDLLQKEAVEESNLNAVVHAFSGVSVNGTERFNILKDVDAAVAEYCERMSIPIPQDIEEKMLIHIRAVEAWADHLMGGEDEKAK